MAPRVHGSGVCDHGFAGFTDEHTARWLELQCRSPSANFKPGCALMLVCDTLMCTHTVYWGVPGHGCAQFIDEHTARWLELQTADHQVLAANLAVPACCCANIHSCAHTLCTGVRDHGFAEFTCGLIAQWLKVQTADHKVLAFNLAVPSCCCAGHAYTHVPTHCALAIAIMALFSSQVST